MQGFGGYRRVRLPRLDSGRGGRHAGRAEEDDGSDGENELSSELHFPFFYTARCFFRYYEKLWAIGISCMEREWQTIYNFMAYTLWTGDPADSHVLVPTDEAQFPSRSPIRFFFVLMARQIRSRQVSACEFPSVSPGTNLGAEWVIISHKSRPGRLVDRAPQREWWQ